MEVAERKNESGGYRNSVRDISCGNNIWRRTGKAVRGKT